MAVYIIDLDAQLATASIQIQCTHLENGFLFARIKIAKRHKIARQFVQITFVTQQLLYRAYGLDFVFNSKILLNQCSDVGPAGAGEYFANARNA